MCIFDKSVDKIVEEKERNSLQKYVIKYIINLVIRKSTHKVESGIAAYILCSRSLNSIKNYSPNKYLGHNESKTQIHFTLVLWEVVFNCTARDQALDYFNEKPWTCIVTVLRRQIWLTMHTKLTHEVALTSKYVETRFTIPFNSVLINNLCYFCKKHIATYQLACNSIILFLINVKLRKPVCTRPFQLLVFEWHVLLAKKFLLAIQITATKIWKLKKI